LFTIGSRLAITHHRRSKTLAGSASVEQVGERPDRGVPAREGQTGIWSLAAACLTAEQHDALWLRYVEELAIAEIAVVMGKSQVAVRVCLFRARQALAERIPMPARAADVGGAPVGVALAGGM